MIESAREGSGRVGVVVPHGVLFRGAAEGKIRQKFIEEYAYRATPQELSNNDFNLNIPRYVDTFKEEAEIDLKAVKQEIASLESQLVTVRAKMADHLKDLGL